MPLKSPFKCSFLNEEGYRGFVNEVTKECYQVMSEVADVNAAQHAVLHKSSSVEFHFQLLSVVF